jgi:hypothetical protein
VDFGCKFWNRANSEYSTAPDVVFRTQIGMTLAPKVFKNIVTAITKTWVVFSRLLYRFIPTLIAFLKENDLLDGIAFGAALGFSFSLPIAIVWGVQSISLRSDALILLFGVFVGGACTVIGALVQAKPQVQEHHRRSVNAARKVITDLGKLERALSAVCTVLGACSGTRPGYWVNPLPHRSQSLLEILASQSLSTVRLTERPTDQALKISLYEELERLRANVEEAAANLQDFIDGMRRWREGGDRDQEQLLISRAAMLVRDVQSALTAVSGFKSRCETYADGW